MTAAPEQRIGTAVAERPPARQRMGMKKEHFVVSTKRGPQERQGPRRHLSTTAAALLALTAGMASANPSLPSPLRLAPGGLPGTATALRLDEAGYEAIREATRVHVGDFILDLNRIVALDLEQFDVLAPDAMLVAASADGEQPIGRPDVVLLRGAVVGQPGSSVFLALSPHGSHGIVRMPDAGGEQMWIVSTPPDPRQGPTVIYNFTALPEGAIQWTDFQCGIQDLAGGAALLPGGSAPRGTGGYEAMDGPLPCRRVRVAVETDWEYTGRFGGDVAAAQAYIITLLGAVSEIFRRDLNTRLEVSYSRVWSDPADPYSSTNVAARLDEFQTHWNANMGHIDRNIAHMLSGLRVGAGGVAWPGVICGGPNAYAISGYIDGSFPYPLINNHAQNWDVKVVAHEIGHNFKAPHTHEMSPPIDQCGIGNCSQAAEGTIMSYCHTCWGGMANISLDLHSRITTEHILPYLASVSCGLELAPAHVAVAPPPRNAYEGQTAQFTAIAGGAGPHTYQWQHNGTDLVDGGPISGATTSTLTIDPVTAGHAGQYTVRIANTCTEVTSPAALLTILEPCYANCDLSTQFPLLTVDDFLCFMNEFATGLTLSYERQVQSYANCDGSTNVPVLTVDDFICFMNEFAAGCP